MKAVIIAGGLGTRLRPLTYNIPKPIVPVANIPFLVHQIEHLKQHGITEIILNLHYMPEAIKALLGDGSQYGVKLYYSIEANPLGTCGAVKNAEEYFDDDPIVVFNGDVLTDINITKIFDYHRRKKAKATITLTPVEDPTAYGLVVLDEDGRVVEFIEKPSWERLEGITEYNINAGIYIIEPSVFKKVPKNTSYMFEHDLFPKLLSEGEPVYGYSSDRYWIDIGNIKKYRQVHEAILRGEVAVRIFGTRESQSLWVGDESKIAHSAKIFGAVLIGKKVNVSDNAVIKDYVVVGDKISIGKNSVVENSILWEDTKIGDHVHISNSILGSNCKIENDCSIKGAVLADNSTITRGSTINV